MSDEDIKISIITICKNAERVIDRTLRSVVEQDYANIEYLIIDGLSTDGTLAIVKRYEDHILTVLSETDSGIYDAMNKGAQKASGHFLLFLNAGDFLVHSSVIRNIVKKVREENLYDVDVLSSQLLLYTPNGAARIWTPRRPSRLSLYMGSLPHPSTFHNKTSFQKNGLFDTTFRIAGDYEWFVRGLVNETLTFHCLSPLTTVFVNDGISTQDNWNKIHREEIELLRSRYFSPRERIWLNFRRFLRKNKII